MIPVDTVVNNIIVSTAKNFHKDALTIYHVGSSDRNPITWEDMKRSVVKYWNNNLSSSRMGKAKVLYSTNSTMIKIN